MTDYLTLTEFVPGTKAKAQEVNANFAALKDAVNSKAVMNGDSTQLFSVAAATADAHAINKSQLTQVSDDFTAELKKTGTKFCVRSGNITSGKGDLFSYSALAITPKIGGAYPDLVLADYKGLQSTITSAATLSMTGKANGTYNIFVTPAGTLYVLANNIYKQPTRPTLVDGDVWLNTSKVPFSCIKYTNSTDAEFLDLPLGKVVIASSAITSLETFPFNQNGYEVNVNTFTQNLAASGWTKLPNGLILQWGSSSFGTTAGNSSLSNTINFPVAFPTACLDIQSSLTTNNTYYSYLAKVNHTQTTSGFILQIYNNTSSSSTGSTWQWLAIGY